MKTNTVNGKEIAHKIQNCEPTTRWDAVPTFDEALFGGVTVVKNCVPKIEQIVDISRNNTPSIDKAFILRLPFCITTLSLMV